MGLRVIVLGGGVAGLTAAHELCERGFEVHVYERRDLLGGKARSVVVPSTAPRQNVSTVHLGRLATSARRDLPGEHGFRFFPRFYKHVIDTMERIPYGAGHTVADNLVDTSGTLFARFDRRWLSLPTQTPTSALALWILLKDLSLVFGRELGVTPDEYAFFGERIWQILTSCSERRMDEYEKIGWWEFIGAEQRSDAYQKLFGIGCTRSVVAAQAKLASTKTIGDMFVQYFFNLSEPRVGADRVLNGPTNDVWIDPWVSYLQENGVEFHLGAQAQSIDCGPNGLIRGVNINDERELREVQGDYYIVALPVEVMVRLTTDSIVRADPSLASLFPLSRDVEWMNGIQYYLADDVPIGRGHQIYLDSPWALTSISQRQFWRDVDLSKFGSGNIRGILSVVISDWETPGLNGKPARECTRAEIRDDVWEQLKRSLNVEGRIVLQDDDIRHWYLDLSVDPLFKENAEPLLVNLVDSWHLRPSAATAIPNLFLAADYVQTSTDLACMEGADEAARLAVNGIIDHSGIGASHARTWNLHEPELLQAWRAADRRRYQQGLPWDDTLARLALSALAALQRGTEAIEAAVQDTLTSALHAEDVLSFVSTGENRSALLDRLLANPTDGSAELLRAFAAISRSPIGDQARTTASSTLEALTSTARNVASGVRFTES